jgi:hypothetical protein
MFANRPYEKLTINIDEDSNIVVLKFHCGSLEEAKSCFGRITSDLENKGECTMILSEAVRAQ